MLSKSEFERNEDTEGDQMVAVVLHPFCVSYPPTPDHTPPPPIYWDSIALIYGQQKIQALQSEVKKRG